MRRVLALAGIATVAVVAAACAEQLATSGAAGQPGVSATVVPLRATPAGDAAVTRRVCVAAVKTAAGGIRVFTDQMALLERAAARDDQTTMVAAATAITTEFSAMAVTLGRLATRSVTPPVKVALVEAAATITELGSASYAGTPADQKEALTELADAFSEVCD